MITKSAAINFRIRLIGCQMIGALYTKELQNYLQQNHIDSIVTMHYVNFWCL